MVANLPIVGVIIAFLALMGIGTMLSFEVKDENRNTLMSGEINNGQIKVEENPKGMLDSIEDGLNQFIQNNLR